MQTEKSQPSGQRIMSETALSVYPWVGISFPALIVDQRDGISRSALFRSSTENFNGKNIRKNFINREFFEQFYFYTFMQNT